MTVNVELLPAVTEGGLSDNVAPLGTPEKLSATVPTEPAVTAVEIVLVLAVFCRILRLDGEALIEKLLLLQLGVAGAIQLAAALENSCCTT